MKTMRANLGAVLLGGLLCAGLAGAAETERVALDDFESAPQGWKYVGGEEFPGAKGSLELDPAVAHGGKTSYRLQADFSGGGAYVGVWRDLGSLAVKDEAEIRLWVKADHVASIGVRFNDATGQCHQQKGVKLAATADWQELVLKPAEIAGGEHWGGANDGAWHGPAAGFGMNVGKDNTADGPKGTLWLDDLSAQVVPPGTATILPCSFSQPAGRPGYGLDVTYRWDAEPMGRDYKAFVHVRDAAGKTVFQDDYELAVGTASWTGRVEHVSTMVLPLDLTPGEYTLVSGLWNPKGNARLPLKTGAGVTMADPNGYRVGTLKVAADAPIPALGKPTLDLTGYRVTFDEDFSEKELSVSPWGPGTRWIAHTPYAGDFGDAKFSDPAPGFPFTLENGILRIEAKKDNGKWRAGLLSSVDSKGQGFSQQYGYFEARAKFPHGPGTWPAFWLLGVTKLTDKKATGAEIDVVEQYGVHPNSLHTCVHLWYADKKHTADPGHFIVDGMENDFHRYGVMVQPDFITFYFDGVELRKTKTPEAAKVPLYLLVNLALGGGWPVKDCPDPSYLYVDYVRAYAK